MALYMSLGSKTSEKPFFIMWKLEEDGGTV